MTETGPDIQAAPRRRPGYAAALAFVLYALLWAAPTLAQQLTEGASPATGISGAIRAQKGQEVQVYSIQVFDFNGGVNPSVSLGDPGGNRGIQLILNDLNAATGFSTSDISAFRLYRSTDAILGAGDTFVASQTTISPLGAATEIDATGAAAALRLIPGGGIFFIATAVISPSAIDGHAFTVSALVNHVAAFEVPPPAGSTAGSPVIASDANHVFIGKAAQPVIGGTLAIPFGGETAMLCLLLGSGAFVLWRRA